MKRILFILLTGLFLSISINAQCTASPGFQCVSDDTVRRFDKALTELAAARETITKLLAERSTSDAVKGQALAVIKGYEDLEIINKRMFASYDQIIALYEKTLNLYATLVDKLTAQLNKPKSAWSKFLDALKTVANIALGIAIGRAIP